GRTWRAYAQSMGWACRWQSNTSTYDVTHNPFVYFKTVQGGASVSSPRCEQNDVDLTADSRHSLAADLRADATTPNFVFIAPADATARASRTIRCCAPGRSHGIFRRSDRATGRRRPC